MRSTLKPGRKRQCRYTRLNVTVDVECVAVEGKKSVFRVRAHDGVDAIGEGRHERFVVTWDKFKARVAGKATMAGVA